MTPRLQALQSKLPHDILTVVRDCDSHPTADLIREVEFERLPGHVYAASGLRLKNCIVWAPLAQELKGRLKHNCSMRSQTRGTWMPVFCYDARTWILRFPRWQFETLEDLDYLPMWVREEYLARVR